MNRLRLIVRLVIAAVWTLVLLPFQLAGLLLYLPLARHVPVLYHRGLLRIFGVHMTVRGEISRSRPLMIVANHVSWLDIVVLSATAPVSFVAKAEMASWPIFGQLAWLQRTIFVKRENRRESAKQANDIADRLNQNDTMVLFPEGTTTDGHGLSPFKTSLFEAVRFAISASSQTQAALQPVAIRYTRLHGMPLGRQWMQHVAWPGEVGLTEHFGPLVGTGALDVDVIFGEPILMDRTSNRKQIAALARERIEDMMRGE